MGEEAWLWSLALMNATKPPQCLGLCLTWTHPGKGMGWGEHVGLHGGYGY